MIKYYQYVKIRKRDKIKTIFKDQLKDDEFRKHCSFVINTGGSFEDTAGQLQNKLEEYKQL